MNSTLFSGMRLENPAIFKVMGSLDVAYDNEKPFREYLKRQQTYETAEKKQLRLRSSNLIHSKAWHANCTTVSFAHAC
jgi:hypothetical protein